MKIPKIKWLKLSEPHNYPAAQSYLELIYPTAKAVSLVAELKKADIKHFKAKDIFRASSLSLLGVSNSHVQTVRKKIKKGQAVSPILLVRDPVNGKVIIADGYHRLCAVYSVHEDIIIPCKIV